VSIVVGLAVVNPDHPDDPTTLVVLLLAQNLPIIGWLALVARRKGTGSLRGDFGFTLRPVDGRWSECVGWFLGGIGLQLAVLIPSGLLTVIYGHHAEQEVATSASHASAWQVPLMVFGVVVLAPVTEELLFRGALLRSLLRRSSPDAAVLVSAGVFAGVHLIGDPSIGSLIAVPAIMLLGVVSGYEATKTGNLSRSMLLHMGFNALSAVLLFTT